MTPALPRSFRKLRVVLPLKNDSWLMIHPAEAAGKKPYWLPLPNLEDPSIRPLSESKYLSLNFKLVRKKVTQEGKHRP